MSWSAGSGRGGTVCPPAGFPPDPCRTVGAVINRPGDSAGVPAGQCAPHSLFGCAKKRTRRARCKRKRRRARSGAVALRATGGGGSVPAPIWPCLRARYALLRFPRLPSRGGWCGGGRGARTHLTSFSFRAFRFATRCPGGCRGRCPHRPAAEAFINHRPAAAKREAGCIPDIPGLKGSPRAGRFRL